MMEVVSVTGTTLTMTTELSSLKMRVKQELERMFRNADLPDYNLFAGMMMLERHGVVPANFKYMLLDECCVCHESYVYGRSPGHEGHNECMKCVMSDEWHEYDTLRCKCKQE